MKIHLALAASAALLFLYCHKKASNDLFPGTWKMERIEVFSKNELRKTIDTGQQYWRFYKHDSIQIFDQHTLQNCLQIHLDKNVISSVDSKLRTDQFSVEVVNPQKLELSSRQSLPDDEYTIVYHLEKMAVEDGLE